MRFTKVDVRKTHPREQAAKFAADYGFTECETLTAAKNGEFHVLLAKNITGKQAARYFRDHLYVAKIETPDGYFVRPNP